MNSSIIDPTKTVPGPGRASPALMTQRRKQEVFLGESAIRVPGPAGGGEWVERDGERFLQDRQLSHDAALSHVRGQRLRSLAVRLQHRWPDLRPQRPGKRAVSLLHGRQDPRCLRDDRAQDRAAGGAGRQDHALAALRHRPVRLRPRAKSVQERAGQQAGVRGSQPRPGPRIQHTPGPAGTASGSSGNRGCSTPARARFAWSCWTDCGTCSPTASTAPHRPS